MAWNPLQKKGNLSTRPTASQGLSSHQEDRQLEIAYVNSKALEDGCRKLGKEVCYILLITISAMLFFCYCIIYLKMKKYEDCLVLLHEQEQAMASQLYNSSAARDDPSLKSLAEYYQSVVYQMRDNTDDLKQLSRKTVQEPLKKLNPEFAAIANAIKKRDTALNECIKAKAKFEKAEKLEKTGPNVQKLEQAKRCYSAAREEYDTQNKLLLVELPQFYEKRIDYFQPCLQALVRSQVNYYGETNCLFTPSNSNDPESQESGTTDMSDAAFKEDIEKHLAAIKSLSIVGK